MRGSKVKKLKKQWSELPEDKKALYRASVVCKKDRSPYDSSYKELLVHACKFSFAKNQNDGHLFHNSLTEDRPKILTGPPSFKKFKRISTGLL